MDHGINICVYPEGKRSRKGAMEPFKDGFFKFAIEYNYEIVPVGMFLPVKIYN